MCLFNSTYRTNLLWNNVRQIIEMREKIHDSAKVYQSSTNFLISKK